MRICGFTLSGSPVRSKGESFRVGDRIWIITEAFPHPVPAIVHVFSIDSEESIRAEVEVYDEDAELFGDVIDGTILPGVTLVHAVVPSDRQIREAFPPASPDERPKKWWQRRTKDG